MAKKQPKPANDKRAALPKRVDYTPVFKKSWERYNRAGRHDMKSARDVMGMLWRGEALPPEYLDHELTGDWAENGVWGAMEPKTNVSSESHRKGAFRSPAHPPGITL